MKLRIALRDSVRNRLFRSWLILGATAIAASLFILVLLIAVERNNQKSRATDDLRSKSAVIARRLSAELLVRERGNVDAVVQGLRQELNVDTIVLLPEGVDCAKTPDSSQCKDHATSSYVWTTERLPHLPTEHFVLVGRSNTLLSDAIPLTTLAVATLSLLGVLLGGIVLQWSAIRRHLLRPINALLETGPKNEEFKDWPVELQRIEGKLRSLLEERDRATSEAHRLKTESMMHDLSQRILHDLKAPLGTLGMMIETDLKQVPAETKDSIRRVLGRIRAIVDTNLKEYSATVLAKNVKPAVAAKAVEKPSSSIGGAIRTILEEEQIKAQQRGVEIVSDIPKSVFQSFTGASFSDLCRVFSNLVTNAVDASEKGKKRLYITAQLSEDACEVTIRDYGTGFDSSVLEKILSGRGTTTKANGNGLGLLTARAIIEQSGGSLDIQSFPDGALLRVRLQRLGTPSWFHDITRSKAEQIVALDDDATMAHQLAAAFPGKKVSFFQSEEDFLKNADGSDSAMLLVDYDFGGTTNGLDLIVSKGLTQRAVLLSGKIAFDPNLRATAEAQGVRLFPKECLA